MITLKDEDTYGAVVLIYVVNPLTLNDDKYQKPHSHLKEDFVIDGSLSRQSLFLAGL